MSIQNVKPYPVSSVFSADEKHIFNIPKYQREYTWGRNEWELLLDDLLDNDLGYFLGTLICIDLKVTPLGGKKFEVIDGQQRLTTISLLMAALYSELSALKPFLCEEEVADLFNLKNRLVIKGSNSELRVVPQVQSNNLDDYRGVMASIGVVRPFALPKFAGNRRVKKAFDYYKGRISGQSDENNKEKIARLFRILEKINSAVMVIIKVLDHSSAFILFESLNNRGTPLTAIDLMKNLVLARMEKETANSIDDSYQTWQQIISFLGDDYTTQERFFRHNYKEPLINSRFSAISW